MHELIHSISYEELVEWIEFYGLDPFGEQRGDIRNAMLMSLMANINRDPKKRQKPYSLDEFMPFKIKAGPKVVHLSDRRDRLENARKLAEKAYNKAKAGHLIESEEMPREGKTNVSAETLTHMFLLANLPMAAKEK